MIKKYSYSQYPKSHLSGSPYQKNSYYYFILNYYYYYFNIITIIISIIPIFFY